MNGLGAAYVRRWLTVLVGGLIAIAAPTAVALVQGGHPATTPVASAAAPAAPPRSPAAGATPSAAAPTASGVSCLQVQDDETCNRIARDAQVRTPLTSAQRGAATAKVQAMRAMIRQAVCPSPCGDPGQPPPEGDGPGPMALQLAGQRLVQAGFDEVIVRRARPDDPAPADAVIYVRFLRTALATL